MAASGYRILDEPRPGPLSHLIVNPFWPLLSLMLGGAWIAWPWFALNAVALGSASLRRELLLIAGAMSTAALTVFATLWIARAIGAADAVSPYARIALFVGKVSFAYALHLRQSSGLALYEYFGGRARNAIGVVITAALGRSYVLDRLATDDYLWGIFS